MKTNLIVMAQLAGLVPFADDSSRNRPKVYAASPCIVAEGSQWNAEEKTLYWVDVTGGRYLRHRDGEAPDAFETVDPGLGKIGARLEHCGADGRLLETVPFPMKKVTSAEVVGRRVFVTTGNKEPDAEAYFRATGAGSVFVIERD